MEATATATEATTARLLEGFCRLPRDLAAHLLRPRVQQVIQAAAEAGGLGPRQEAQMAAWKARAGLNKPAPVQTEAPRASVEQPRRRPQPHKQIARRHWNVSSRYYDVRAAAERAGLTRIAPPAAAPSGWTVRHEGRRTPTRYTGHAGDQEARTGGLAGGDLHVDAEG